MGPVLSFSQYPQSSIMTPIRLAQAGFFYQGHDETVRCFSCRVIIDTWREAETAFDAHRRMSPNCDFIRGRHTNNVSIHNSEYYVALFMESNTCETSCDENTNSSRHTDAGNISERHGQNNVSDSSSRATSNNANSEVQGQQNVRHPTYTTFDRRMDSFANWQFQEVQSPKRLAEAGFFYTGIRDCVRCHVCGIGVQEWSHEDIPYSEHARLSPNCGFLKRTGDKQINGASSSPRLNGTEATSTNGIETSAEMSRNSKPSVKDNATKHDDRRSTNKDVAQGVASDESGKSNTALTPGTRQNKKMSKDAKAIADENRSLKAQMTCKICLDKGCDVVFLPCGHMIACQKCAQSLRKCTICRNLIRGMVHVYQS